MRLLLATTAAVLLLCSTGQAASRATYLPCSTSNGARGLVPKQRPISCLTLDPTASLAGSVDLVKLRWRHWGTATATATATSLSFHLPRERVPVTVRATRWEYDGAGHRYYSHLRIRSRYGTGDVWLAPGSVYPEYRITFRDGVRAYLGEDAVSVVRVHSDTQCNFGAPGRWRCTTTAEAPDGCLYDMKGHFDRDYNLTIDVAKPSADNTLDCGPPVRQP
jgi:hypothetical protein